MPPRPASDQQAPPVSPILAVIDRMMAAPAAERSQSEPTRNAHAGAAAANAPPPPVPVLGSKGINVERSPLVKDSLDEAADLFKVIFKGEIIP